MHRQWSAGAGAGAGCAQPFPTLHSVTSPQKSANIQIRDFLKPGFKLLPAHHWLQGLPGNQNIGRWIDPAPFSSLTSCPLLYPIHPVLATPAFWPILTQAGSAPASRLLYLLFLFPQTSAGLAGSLTSLRLAEMSPSQWVPPKGHPPPPVSLPALSFSVALNTISLMVSLLVYPFYSLPHPQLILCLTPS